MQYTIRQVPKHLNKALRAKAKAERRSLNQIAVEAMCAGMGVPVDPTKTRDISDLLGTLSKEDARAIEEAVAWMDKADLEFQQKGER